mmetsp:Transcript_2392/g.6988  ORF Transcript_2392/g.6988 Transcript_2392/m.6988 type:complete len:233 (+) Transcript_2392:1426-2124(+)
MSSAMVPAYCDRCWSSAGDHAGWLRARRAEGTPPRSDSAAARRGAVVDKPRFPGPKRCWVAPGGPAAADAGLRARIACAAVPEAMAPEVAGTLTRGLLCACRSSVAEAGLPWPTDWPATRVDATLAADPVVPASSRTCCADVWWCTAPPLPCGMAFDGGYAGRMMAALPGRELPPAFPAWAPNEGLRPCVESAATCAARGSPFCTSHAVMILGRGASWRAALRQCSCCVVYA